MSSHRERILALLKDGIENPPTRITSALSALTLALTDAMATRKKEENDKGTAEEEKDAVTNLHHLCALAHSVVTAKVGTAENASFSTIVVATSPSPSRRNRFEGSPSSSPTKDDASLTSSMIAAITLASGQAVASLLCALLPLLDQQQPELPINTCLPTSILSSMALLLVNCVGRTITPQQALDAWCTSDELRMWCCNMVLEAPQHHEAQGQHVVSLLLCPKHQLFFALCDALTQVSIGPLEEKEALHQLRDTAEAWLNYSTSLPSAQYPDDPKERLVLGTRQHIVGCFVAAWKNDLTAAEPATALPECSASSSLFSPSIRRSSQQQNVKSPLGLASPTSPKIIATSLPRCSSPSVGSPTTTHLTEDEVVELFTKEKANLEAVVVERSQQLANLMDENERLADHVEELRLRVLLRSTDTRTHSSLGDDANKGETNGHTTIDADTKEEDTNALRALEAHVAALEERLHKQRETNEVEMLFLSNVAAKQEELLQVKQETKIEEKKEAAGLLKDDDPLL